MEPLPKEHEEAIVVIDIDDDGEEEEEQANQTENEEEEQANQTENEEEEEEEDMRHSTSSSSKSRTTEIIKERRCSVSSMEVDLESEEIETKQLHLENVERDCRICHLSLDPSNQECDLPIELGCSCKEDLAVAHKHCAEAWFKIKGNRICEICGSTARNVAGANETEMTEQWNESNDSTSTAAAVPTGIRGAESRNFWQGHRFLNFLLACMVFAFVISWLFHFNIPS